MERGKKTGFILRQFRRKSKRIVNKDLFTEFFYLNKNRRIIEFLSQDETLVYEEFFKQFVPDEMKGFIKVRILNDLEDEINIWYYDAENLTIVIDINWGFKKQEISIDVNIENFCVSAIDQQGVIVREVDYTMLNDYLISFATIQARNISETFENLGSSLEDNK